MKLTCTHNVSLADTCDKCRGTFYHKEMTPYDTSSSGMLKHAAGKTKLELVPVDWTLEQAAAMEYGAFNKVPHPYGPMNWAKGGSWMALVAAGMRHVFKWVKGEDFDSESKQHHLVHASINFMMARTQQKLNRGEDDRKFYQEGQE